MAVRNAVKEIKTSSDRNQNIERSKSSRLRDYDRKSSKQKKIINQNSIPTNSYLNILKEIPWKNISQYLGYSHIDNSGSGKPVDKCELNLTAETPWILPIDNMAWGEEETNHFENLKLLKGPSRYWKTTYTNEFYKKNGKENIKYTFLDNSFYEIGSNSEEWTFSGLSHTLHVILGIL